jgi:tetratricopeptide (TPR) repeat protein
VSTRGELGTLEASGLIEIAALQPELEYLFRHALVQDAAYSSLLKQDRRTLHRAAAETILLLHPERERELAGVIAMHFEQAGDTVQAVQHLVTAGEHALERFANKEAAAFFLRAGALADDSQFDLRLRAAVGGAKAGWTSNESGSDVDRLERALADAGRADQRLVTEAYFWVAFLRRQRGEVPESSPALKDALERAAQVGKAIGDPNAAALPKALMGSYIAFTGRLREGAHEMQEALGAIEAKGDSLSSAMVSDFLAMTYARLGDFAKAEETIEHSKRFAGDGDAIARVDVMIAGSSIHLERGELDKASAQSLECAARSEELGAYACVVASNVMYGAASLALENAPAAKGPLERGSELCLVTNMAPMRTLIQSLLASARAQLGDLPGGVAGWDEALASARAMNDRFGEAQTLWGRGRTLARQAKPDWGAALADLDRAVELFEDMEARPSLARGLHDRAQALRALGRADDAAEAERRSGELARELGLKDLPPAALPDPTGGR